MKLFPPQIEIADGEGFSAEKDIFGRKEIGEGLTNLVTKVDEPLVLAIDGQWGSGKSVFLKMWRGDLKQRGIPYVYFDAFENDYFEDAFVPIAAEIVSLAKASQDVCKARAQKFADTAVKVGKTILRGGLRVAVKAATAGVIDAGDIEGAIVEEVEGAVDKHIGELITQQSQAKSTIEQFRKALTELPELLLAKSGQQDANKSLVIIIDELDRCRPYFALQLLERIKHFFSVPNVHFILGVNMRQLENSVVATYGQGVDGQLYLQKFIQLSVQLNEQLPDQPTLVATRYVEHLYNWHGVSEKGAGDFRECCDLFKKILKYKSFSLRTIEQIVATIARTVIAIPERQFSNETIIVGLSVLKVVRPILYEAAKNGSLRFEDVLDVFGMVDPRGLDAVSRDSPLAERISSQRWFATWWQYLLDEKCPDDIVQQLRSYIPYGIRDRLTLLQFCEKNQVDRFQAL